MEKSSVFLLFLLHPGGHWRRLVGLDYHIPIQVSPLGDELAT